MCAYWQHPTAPTDELDLQGIRAGLRKVHAHGCRFINFTGGEPTLRQDLEAIVAAAAGLGIWTSIVTNGATLTRERLRHLRDAGLDNLLVSLDSIDPAAHDANRGVPGLHRRVLEISDWLAADFLTGHRTGGFMSVLRASNLHEASDLVRLAEERGVYLIVQRYHANKTGDASPLPVFSNAQAAELLSLKRSPALLSSRDYLRGIVAPPARARACHAGRKYFSVDPFGFVHPCVDLPAVGHVLDDDLGVLWSSAARQAVAACGGCWYCFRGEADCSLRLAGAAAKVSMIAHVIYGNARRGSAARIRGWKSRFARSSAPTPSRT
jgi:MoaA/NifB/PqqE/SkfB family radical SAM enzyme